MKLKLPSSFYLILSYTVSKLGYFFETQCIEHTAY